MSWRVAVDRGRTLARPPGKTAEQIWKQIKQSAALCVSLDDGTDRWIVVNPGYVIQVSDRERGRATP